MAESDVAIVMPEICFRISAEEVDKEVKETQEKEEVEIESEEAAAGEEAKEAKQDLKRKLEVQEETERQLEGASNGEDGNEGEEEREGSEAKRQKTETEVVVKSEFLSTMAITKSMAGNALVRSYNDNIRPLLDAVDRLRHLKVTDEGIQIPTIVVVGDQSSGKSSVLESLAGISLPRGQGICTRVPLVMRLQGDPDATEPLLHLEYRSKTVETTEAGITEAINEATVEIAGAGKGISDAPITLVVKKKGVPDLTLVDLPGITRVPVHGQPEDIYEQISHTIMGYIAPKESIILNVLSATVDFPTCESIRMSQKVDPLGERTLAVVTKSL